MSRFWIVDGHNVIFAIPQLRTLQVSGHREEARQGLVDALRRFTRARRDHLLVVFDGGDPQSHQDVIREPWLEVVYTKHSPGGADDRIIREAKSLRKDGHRVTVVTNDVITLAALLPKDVDHVKVGPFWETYIDMAEGKADKRVEGDFSEVEKEMLARAAMAESDASTFRRTHFSTRPAAAAPSTTQGRVAAKDAVRERLRVKKAKGKARHQRRFKRR